MDKEGIRRGAREETRTEKGTKEGTDKVTRVSRGEEKRQNQILN